MEVRCFRGALFQKFTVSEVHCFRDVLFRKCSVSEVHCFKGALFRRCTVLFRLWMMIMFTGIVELAVQDSGGGALFRFMSKESGSLPPTWNCFYY